MKLAVLDGYQMENYEVLVPQVLSLFDTSYATLNENGDGRTRELTTL